jgi:multiple sugar transport system permease protein
MMFSPILVGFQFKYLFNDAVGLVNNALFDLHIIREPIAWLVDGTLAPLTIIIAEVWMSTSVFAILLLAGLGPCPRSLLKRRASMDAIRSRSSGTSRCRS